MIGTCRDLRDSLAHGPSDTLGNEAQAHLATCTDCRAQAAAHERIVMALRQEPEPIDDFARTRLLAKLGPKLDDLARDRATAHRSWRGSGRWLALVAVATSAAGITWWIGRSEPTQPHAATVTLERDQLRPYVVAGPRSDSAAATLLGGRFSTLVVGDHELVRATAGDRDLRVGAIGPARIDVEAATPQTIALATTGTLLVDARSTRAIDVRSGALHVRATNATFAVQQSPTTTVIFIERGEIELGNTRLHAGDWYGPTEARSAGLVTALRDQEHASPPPIDHDGILAIDGSSRAVTESGAVLGTAPLWARLMEGEVVVVLTGEDEHRVPITVRAGVVVHVPHSVPAPQRPLTRSISGPAVPSPITDTAAVSNTQVAATSPRTPEPSARLHDTTAPPAVRGLAPAAVREDRGVSPDAGTAAAAEPTPSELYAQAESALRRGDATLATTTWTQLVVRYPSTPQAASALYDLAGLARARGDRTRARAYLAQIDERSATIALREPARYLSCRLAVESTDVTTATTCFTMFRTTFPHSSHDEEVLAWLAGHAEETGGCEAARALFAEYLHRYPQGSLATRARGCDPARGSGR